MLSLRVAVLTIACLAVIMWIPTDARSDEIHLRDGRVLVGKILWDESSDAELRIDTKLHGIRATIPVKRSDIDRIERRPLPEGFFETKPEPLSQPGTPSDSRTTTAERVPRYMLVPLLGGFGDDFDGEAVQECLEYASKNGFELIVFELNSPGGYTHIANDIQSAMRRHAHGLEYSVVFEDAHSASIWVLAGADRLYVIPESSAGGAVGYTRNSSTGEVAVDAKMNSILAAEQSAFADSRGTLPGVLIRAMIVLEAEAWAFKPTEEDPWVFSDVEPPTDVAERLHLDGPSTILTLTGPQLIKLGLAEPVEVLAARLQSMRDDGGRGERLMELARRRIQAGAKERETILDWYGRMPELISVARSNGHPDEFFDYEIVQVAVPLQNGGYRYVEQMTTAARQKWNRRYHDWRNGWMSVGNGIQDIKRRVARYSGRDPLPEGIVTQLNAWETEARNELNR